MGEIAKIVEKDEKIATIYSNIAITNDMISEFQSHIMIGDSAVEPKEILEIICKL